MIVDWELITMNFFLAVLLGFVIYVGYSFAFVRELSGIDIAINYIILLLAFICILIKFLEMWRFA